MFLACDSSASWCPWFWKVLKDLDSGMPAFESCLCHFLTMSLDKGLHVSESATSFVKMRIFIALLLQCCCKCYIKEFTLPMLSKLAHSVIPHQNQKDESLMLQLEHCTLSPIQNVASFSWFKSQDGWANCPLIFCGLYAPVITVRSSSLLLFPMRKRWWWGEMVPKLTQ
jgi:hypothetical protein